jgi:phenylacetaldehyde dehydrogenase
LIQEAGFPAGVINIVTGYGPEAGKALADHPGVDKISFTGSTAVGKSLVHAAAENLKRLTLELGGKSPAIVFKDADFDLAVRGVLQNFTFNAGQICVAGSRVYVEKNIFTRFVDGLAAQAKAIRVGPAVDSKTQMGPLISEKQLERVAGYVEGALSNGAKVVTGGGYGGDGFYFDPTILTDTEPAMAVRREEIFGPVAALIPFDGDDLEGLVAEANNTEYGLSAYIYTRDLSTAHRIAARIQAGMIRVNGAALDYTMPFGGYKQSGWGRENGQEGVLAFTELKTVAMAL